MKKVMLIIAAILIAVIAVLCYKVHLNNIQMSKINLENANFTDLYNKEILGTDVATVLNKVDDLNNKNKVKKDNNESFVENDTDSIKIDIKFKELEDAIPFEKIEKQGINQFIINFGSFSFKCTNIEFHQKTNKIKYMLFEEI